MASPIAHVLAGWSLCLLARPARIRWQDAIAAAALTVLADFDLIAIAFVGAAEGHYWHHTFTHTFAFAILAGVVYSVVSRIRLGAPRIQEAILVTLLIASHTVVDYYTVDRSLPIGVPAFWPWSTEFFKAPHPVFLNIERTSFESLLGEHNRRAMLSELAVMLPAFGFCGLWYRWSWRRSKS